MKSLGKLVWITQLGMSVAAPMAGFTLIGVWLKNKFSLGAWIIAVFCLVGLISACDSFRLTLKAMEKAEKKDDPEPPVSFNEHK